MSVPLPSRLGDCDMTVEQASPGARFADALPFRELTRHYALTPSAVLVRTPEAELLRSIAVRPPVLDLCCGDGFFASLIRESGFDAGCDINDRSLRRAARRGLHKYLARANITQGIPFRDGHFGTIVSNSSLEHVREIDKALAEIARVLHPGGSIHMTFGSNFAYEWWPCGKEALHRYREFQPVHNSFAFEEWEDRMKKVGLRVVSHSYYLSRRATRLLCFLDYHFSNTLMTSERTIARFLIRLMRVFPRTSWASVWMILFARIRILQREEGGGIWIVAERESGV